MTPSNVAQPSFRLWVWLMIGVAFTLRCILILENAGSSRALALATPDDSYYYYIPLRHLVEGMGISFDGTTPTNGFHPLWFALLVPVFAVLRGAGPDAPIIAGMIIASVCTVVAGYLLWRTVRRVTGHEFAAGLVLVLFLFNPYMISASLNGLETGVHLLCVAGLLALLARLYTQPTFSRADVLRLGVWVGLVFLSRTDAVILLAVLMSLLLLARPVPRRVFDLALAGLLAVVIALPWLAWNYAQFGSVIQSSGAPLTLNAQRRFEVLTGGADSLPERLTLLLYYVRMGARYAGFSVVAMLVLVVPPLVGYLLSRRKLRRIWLTGSQARWLLVGGIYFLSYIAFNALVRWLMRDWYFATPVFVFYVALGVLFALVLRGPMIQRWLARWHSTRLILMGGLLLAVMSVGWLEESSQNPNNPVFRFWASPVRYPGQAGMYNAALWMQANPSRTEEARFGSFNAGIVTYYSRRTVINLDGLMNHAIQPYIAQNRLLCYLIEADLDYIVDFNYVYPDWAPLFTPDLSVSGDDLRATTTTAFEDAAIPPSGYAVVALDKARLRALGRPSCAP